jgi:glutamate N-acetyltransferase / amino-acid N-acetyltransferase
VTDKTLLIPGFRFSAVSAGVKNPSSDRLDLALICADRPAVTAGVTTTNLVCAAPVVITRERLATGLSQAALLNSGNANAATGKKGTDYALALIEETAGALAMDPSLIIPMSTGVIGVPLPLERMRARIPALVDGLDETRFSDVAAAIMTTDTRPKTVVLERRFSNGPAKILGLTKGAGMIAPNMATMLAVVLTNVTVELSFLREAVQRAAKASFNCVTVDGDTSTNDTLIVMSSVGQGSVRLSDGSADRDAFEDMLGEACKDLARQIIADGEGATKLVEVRVVGAPNNEAAHIVARTISESPLVKTAFFGEDPNWGRIIAAAGRAGVSFNPDLLDLHIGDVLVLRNGAPVTEEWEPRAHEIMKQREFSVNLDLKNGDGIATFLTTDFSHEYVSINADYRT